MLNDAELLRLGDALLHGHADAILYADHAGIIQFWNPAAERIFGFSAAEAVGASLDIIVPERQRDRHWTGWNEVVASGKSRYGEGDLLSVPALRKDGSRISVEFTITIVRDAAGSLAGFAAVLRDVSARFAELRTLRRQAAAAAERTPVTPPDHT